MKSSIKIFVLTIFLITAMAAAVLAQRIRVNGINFFSSGLASTNLCLDPTNQDIYIGRVGTNDLGIYTGATACATGTLRADVSGTTLTLGAVDLLWTTDNSKNIGAVGATRPKTIFAGTGFAGNHVDPTDNTKVLALSLSGVTTATTLTLSSAQSTAQTLTIPNIAGAETLALVPAISTTLSTPLNPTGTTNTSGLMMGLAKLITPSTTRVFVTVNGQIVNGTATDGAKVEIRMGTGAAPSNAGALAGTVYGSQQAATTLAGEGAIPFSLTALVTGLTAGTQYWIDVDLAAITAGTATISSVSVSAFAL